MVFYTQINLNFIIKQDIINMQNSIPHDYHAQILVATGKTYNQINRMRDTLKRKIRATFPHIKPTPRGLSVSALAESKLVRIGMHTKGDQVYLYLQSKGVEHSYNGIESGTELARIADLLCEKMLPRFKEVFSA